MADRFLDLNGEVRLQGTLIAPGGLLPAGGTTGQVLTKASDSDGDADWEAGGAFNGGTITGALTVAPVGTDAAAITAQAPDSGDDALLLKDHLAGTLVQISDGSLFDFTMRPGQDGRFRLRTGSGADTFNIELVSGVQRIGFYGVVTVAQPVLTSSTATPEQIALALQALGLCGGT